MTFEITTENSDLVDGKPFQVFEDDELQGGFYTKTAAYLFIAGLCINYAEAEEDKPHA